MWHCPVPKQLITTQESESFRDMRPRETGLPYPPHPGGFGVVRKHHCHEGVDLYVEDKSIVAAVEAGTVVGVLPFTGAHAGSPWWHDTWAVLVEGTSGVVVYGEVNTAIKTNIEIKAGDIVGLVTPVLMKDKGRPMTMLHLELHVHGTRDVYEWPVHGPRPASLLDPTPMLREVADRQKRS